MEGLVFVKERLAKLLPRPKPRVDDRDVDPRFEAGEPDHPLGEIANAQRLPHVEDEDLPPAPVRRGLENERDGFVDQHEVAGHLGVGHGERTTLEDLPAEEGDDRPRGIEDIAETGDDRTHRAVRTGAEEQFRRPLARAHHASGVNRLVGRDLHKKLGPTAGGLVHQNHRSENVVAHHGPDVGFGKRHVFVGGRMEDDFGGVLNEEAAERRRVQDACENRTAHAVRARSAVLHDAVERFLVVVEDENERRIVTEDLADEFGADRSATAAHEDAASAKKFGRRPVVETHGVPAQQILDLNRAEIGRGKRPATHFGEERHAPAGHTGAGAMGDDPVEDIGTDGRDGDEDRLRAVHRNEAGEIVDAAHDADAVDFVALFPRIVVHEARGPVAAAPAELAEKKLGSLTGPDDEDGRPPARAEIEALVVESAHESAQRGGGPKEEDGKKNEESGREPCEGPVRREHHKHQDPGPDHGERKAHELGERNVAPESAVSPGEPEHEPQNRKSRSGQDHDPGASPRRRVPRVRGAEKQEETEEDDEKEHEVGAKPQRPAEPGADGRFAQS